MLDDAASASWRCDDHPIMPKRLEMKRILDASRGTCGATNARDGPAGGFTSNRDAYIR